VSERAVRAKRGGSHVEIGSGQSGSPHPDPLPEGEGEQGEARVEGEGEQQAPRVEGEGERAARAGREGEGEGELELPSSVAILPSREAVLYPGMLLPLQVGEPRWVRLLSDAVSAHQPVGLFLQRDPKAEVETAEQLYPVGTAAIVVRLLKLPDGSVQVLLQGAARIRLNAISQTDPYLRGEADLLPGEVQPTQLDVETEGLVRNLQSLFQRLVQLSPVLPAEMAVAASNLDVPGRLADFVAANCDLEPPQRQAVLEYLDPHARARHVTELLTRELEVAEIGSRIQSQVRETMDRSQREFYLRQQLAAIRKELGETDEAEAALVGLRERLDKAGLPPEVRAEADRELNRFSSIPSASPEHSMVRTYLEWLADLPWSAVTPDNLDLPHAKRVLDEDHHDLDRVKDRILEFLAVMKLRADALTETEGENKAGSLRGPILCLVGPPGVGKTSLGLSIARALGRKFVRMSLGGVRDEAEIRGHRRTYIGAMPGRIIQGLRRAGSKNPVFILDELDKLGADWRGDPSSALLEVLDPAQNSDFRDHYLDVPFDLSSVLFIATANVLDTVPPALRDRLEVIDLPGYTEDDKLQIARRYLVPRQLVENGLDPERVKVSDAALRRVIREYTREAGVRNLEREIATLARKSARAIVMGEATSVGISSAKQLREMLGPPRVQQEVAEREDEVGVATGLAFTPVGGEVLFIEARAVPGRGNLVLTGQLGEVMKESAQAALTYARSRAKVLGLKSDDPLDETDVHVHVPAGAVPKDGPSAGITMATAIISALTNRPVDHTVGMTGEITLRGRVMPIGGLKEKVLAAHRAGLRRVIVPRDNRKDIDDVPQRVRRQIAFTFVDHVDQVLNVALKREVRTERADVKPVARARRRTRDTVAASPAG
jgi:ATP-dependent Lon protease